MTINEQLGLSSSRHEVQWDLLVIDSVQAPTPDSIRLDLRTSE
jgi:hypothetical protein